MELAHQTCPKPRKIFTGSRRSDGAQKCAKTTARSQSTRTRLKFFYYKAIHESATVPLRPFHSTPYLSIFNNPVPMLSIVWALICLLTFHSPLVTAYTYDLYCNKELYGTPNVDDCKEATEWIPVCYISYTITLGTCLKTCIPYPKEKRWLEIVKWIHESIGRFDRNNATISRKFAEPQYLKPPVSYIFLFVFAQFDV